jgi:hypothetical protein
MICTLVASGRATTAPQKVDAGSRQNPPASQRRSISSPIVIFVGAKTGSA